MFPSMNKTLSRVPRGVVYILITLPFILSLLYVWAFGVNVPFGDQFAVAKLFLGLSRGELELQALTSPHNEHRIPIPTAVMLALGVLTGYNVLVEMYVIQVCLLATMVVFLLAFKENVRASLFFFIPVSLLIFSFRQYENLLWGWQITFAFAQTFGVLALYLLHASLGGKRPKLAFSGAIVSGFIASFSALPGLLAWPAGLAMIVIGEAGRSAKARLGAIWSAAWVATWTLYFIGYAPNRQASPFFEYLAQNPIGSILYFPTFLGAGLFWHLPLAIVGGVAFVGLALLSVFVLYKQGKLGENAFWIGVLLFSFGIAVTVLYGRAAFGLESATASRYTVFSMLASISVYVILLKLVLETGTRALTTIAASFCAALLLTLASSYYAGLVLGKESETMRERATVALYNYETTPNNAFKPLFNQPPENARRIAARLERFEYSVFSKSPPGKASGEADSTPGRT